MEERLLNVRECLAYGYSRIKIRGKIEDIFQYSHTTVDDIIMFSNVVHVTRKSGKVDKVPIIIPEDLCSYDSIVGKTVELSGDLRTYKKYDENGHVHHDLFMFVKFLKECSNFDEHVNEVELEGEIYWEPSIRLAGNNKLITNFSIMVINPYDNNFAIRCISWGRNAIYTSKMLPKERVRCLGRFQSRTYLKTVYSEDGVAVKEERETFEISVHSIEKVDW